MGATEVTRRVLVIVVVAGTLAAIFAIRPLKTFLDIDACLDQGGAWEKQTGTCVGTHNTQDHRR